MMSAYDRRRQFYKEHPEFFGRAPQILATYITCSMRRGTLKGPHVDVFEAYDHIFVKNGGCKWCQKELKIAIERCKDFEEGRVGAY